MSPAARRYQHGAVDGEGLVSLYFVDAIGALSSETGRRREAAHWRSHFVSHRDKLGLEMPRYLKAARAIEEQDWSTLGRLLRAVERDRWRREIANVRRDHAGVLQLAHELESGALPNRQEAS